MKLSQRIEALRESIAQQEANLEDSRDHLESLERKLKKNNPKRLKKQHRKRLMNLRNLKIMLLGDQKMTFLEKLGFFLLNAGSFVLYVLFMSGFLSEVLR